MKKIVIIATCLFTAIACSRKTIPPANTHVITTPAHADTNAKVPLAMTADTATVTAGANPNAAAVLVVSDANGKIIATEKNLPPDANVTFDYLQLSKGFTPQQKINLNTRYKTIPPRVLYVGKQYQLNSLRGTYYIFKKKFWYWKKSDGLFYLDEKYYL